jgi:hypothetical protein
LECGFGMDTLEFEECPNTNTFPLPPLLLPIKKHSLTSKEGLSVETPKKRNKYVSNTHSIFRVDQSPTQRDSRIVQQGHYHQKLPFWTAVPLQRQKMCLIIPLYRGVEWPSLADRWGLKILCWILAQNTTPSNAGNQ